MDMNDILADIREANLNYLLLAQQLIREDRATAIFRLGISAELADLVDKLSTTHMLKLAASNLLLMRLRLDDPALLRTLISCAHERSLMQAHAVILMAKKGIQEIV